MFKSNASSNNPPPPWWPAGDEWPPAGKDRAWARGRRRFFMRAAMLFGLVMILVSCGSSIAVLTVADELGWVTVAPQVADLPPIPPPPVAPSDPAQAARNPVRNAIQRWMTQGRRAMPRGFVVFPILIIGGLIFFAVRGFRRAATPVANLIEASTRLESGDYSARVAVQGPSEVRSLTTAFNSMAARLESNEQSRRNMLADVTHELRTPLTVIQGNLEALIDGVYPRDEAHIAPILDETHVLARLIEDLRTLSMAEAGILRLQREPIDIGALARDAVGSLRAKSDPAQVQLAVDVADGLPLVNADAVRVREVLVNLIGNALRYTPAGGRIDVRVEREGGSAAITVRDTGKGISPELLEHVFDRFYKSRDSMGSGLGLAIAKQLVEAHGGAITAQSVVGAGTIMRFKLPLKESD